MKKRSDYIIYLLLILACILSRVPELVSPNLLLDGDECVVALMAKHMANHSAFYPFFYGQTYGFSLIECLFIIPFYLLFGVTALSVKCTMLLLWTLGALFLYRAFILINKTGYQWLPLLLTLLFILSPAWAVWSMKARGGYLTAFACSSIVLNLIFSNKKNMPGIFLTGLLTYIIYLAQPLWLPGLAPFLILYLIRDKRALSLFVFALPVTTLAIWIHFYNRGALTFGVIPIHLHTDDLYERITRIPWFVYNSLHGSYYFGQVQKPNLFCAIPAVVMEVLTLSLPVIFICRMLTKKKVTLLFGLSVLSVLFTIGNSVLSADIQCRYLLPLTGFALLSVLLLLNSVRFRPGILIVSTSAYLAFGIVALITFYDFSFVPIKEIRLKPALRSLSDKGVHYAFCADNLFAWQVMFYSNERILCHEMQFPGRFPKYWWQVDSAFYSGAKTAYIAYTGLWSPVTFQNTEVINDLTVVIDPPHDIIAKNFSRMTQRPTYYYCK